MMRCVVDTDILSELSKGKNPLVLQRVNTYLAQHVRLTFSLLTRYEVLRGLKAKRATARLARFERFCGQHEVLPITDDIIVVAADLWATLKQAGQPISEIDYFIAATALRHGLAVATRNVAHFGRVPGLTVEDWSRP
jgi:tRNA(fMet)-specific endonuclease VapC